MKFMVCGSGDAVGIPGLFCRCPVCVSARENGGRERRSRTGYLLGDAVKFDFGPDTAMQARELGFDLTKLRRIFITHSHSDHFGAEELWNQTLGVSAPEQSVEAACAVPEFRYHAANAIAPFRRNRIVRRDPGDGDCDRPHPHRGVSDVSD